MFSSVFGDQSIFRNTETQMQLFKKILSAGIVLMRNLHLKTPRILSLESQVCVQIQVKSCVIGRSTRRYVSNTHRCGNNTPKCVNNTQINNRQRSFFFFSFLRCTSATSCYDLGMDRVAYSKTTFKIHFAFSLN